MPYRGELYMSEEMPKQPEKTRKLDENVVFIGQKPVMNYVIACLTFFNTGGGNKVCVKARGMAISRAVDTIEVLRRSFVKDLKIADIKIGTEEVTGEQGRRSNVSTIEITVAKS
jgi:DNA-binding protein